MARIRTVKPEFWCSEQVVECSTTARLMLLGILNFCDDGGVIPMKPLQIKMQVFPGDPFTVDEISEWIDELVSAGLCCVFENKSQQYLQVTGFTKHQRLDKPTYKYPQALSDGSKTIRGVVVEDSESTPRLLTPGREGKGKERNKNTTSDSDDSDNGFETLWANKPTRPNQNKRKTLKAYNARIREGHTLKTLLDGLERYNRYCEHEKTDPRHRMHLATFIGPDKHFELPWYCADKVPEDREQIVQLAAERKVSIRGMNVPAARKHLAAELGMQL